jgi:DNA uptake protein ComE-like DNA-binding protein
LDSEATLASVAHISDNGSVILGRQVLLAACATLLVSLSASSQVAQNARFAPPPEERVDINHASLKELMKVPGMTQSWAGRIIRFRPYHTKDDLVEHGVITGAVYIRIKDYVIAHRDPQ